MVIFDRCDIYIQSQTTLLAKIKAIEAVIQALEDQALKATLNESVEEYQLNTGQTIIRQVYRGSAAIGKAINDFEAIKQRYVNRYNGRVIRAVDSKNFQNFYGRW